MVNKRGVKRGIHWKTVLFVILLVVLGGIVALYVSDDVRLSPSAHPLDNYAYPEALDVYWGLRNNPYYSGAPYDETLKAIDGLLDDQSRALSDRYLLYDAAYQQLRIYDYSVNVNNLTQYTSQLSLAQRDVEWHNRFIQHHIIMMQIYHEAKQIALDIGNPLAVPYVSVDDGSPSGEVIVPSEDGSDSSPSTSEDGSN